MTMHSDKNLHAPGAKDDSEKDFAGLVMGDFARALKEVVKVGTFGAKKYSKSGWLKVPNAAERYADALARHELDLMSGITHDPESKLLHRAHQAWNVLALLELA